ncbi:MAG: 2-amino-4-hydroxy-6-hydroxymethyldihydropteridine diphosphokinase [Bdellovibrio bacteriovorus]
MAWPDPGAGAGLEGIAFIGLGSNLGEPRTQVLAAIGEIAALPGCQLVARSSLYATTPVGPVPQPDYINAAVALATRLAPTELLTALQEIERAHGRQRDGTRWGPRTLDLDLLLHGGHRLPGPGLELPHPEMHRRAFVLVPLAEIAPEWLEIPGRGRLADVLAACPPDERMGRIPECPPEADKSGRPELSSPPV